jgi:DNA-binding IclR family transcriptional regulator
MSIPPLPAQANQSVIHGVECLQALIAEGAPLGSSSLARQLGLNQSTVSRLLGTLSAIGMAERTSGGKYRPGPGVHVLAAQSLRGSHLLTVALPILEELRAPGLAIALGVLWRDSICYLYHARPGLRGVIGSHALVPATHSSTGILLLSRLERSDSGKRLRNLQETERRTIETPKDAVSSARDKGHARLTFPSGDTSLAVAVGHPAVASLAFAGKFTATEEKARLIQLIDTAAIITADLSAALASQEPVSVAHSTLRPSLDV